MEQVTKELVINEFMGAVRCMIDYWARQEDQTDKEKIEGFAHSMLCAMSGMSGSFGGSVDQFYYQWEDDDGNEQSGFFDIDVMLHHLLYQNREQRIISLESDQ